MGGDVTGTASHVRHRTVTGGSDQLREDGDHRVVERVRVVTRGDALGVKGGDGVVGGTGGGEEVRLGHGRPC